MRRIGLLGCAAALLVALMAPPAAAQEIQILHASDLEGGVGAIDDAPNFAAIVEGLEDDAATAGIPSITLSAGDNYIPGPFFSAAGDRSLRTPLQQAYDALFGLPPGSLSNIREGVGRVDITIMNIIGFAASCVGNHEFDAGPDTFGGLIGTDIRGAGLGDVRWLGAQFPYLSSNLAFGSGGGLSGLFSDPSVDGILDNTEFHSLPSDLIAAAAAPKLAVATIVEAGGTEIGVIGATTPLVESISSTGDTTVKNPGAGTNDMSDLASIIQPVIDQLKADGIAKIVLVTHLQQISLEQSLVPLLTDVDVAIAGGSDTILANAGDRLRSGDTASGPYPIVTANKDGDPAVIVSTDGQYSYVGKLVVEFDGDVLDTSGLATSGSRPIPTDDQGVTDIWGNLTDPFATGTKGAEVKKLTDAVRGIVTAKDGNTFGNTEVFLEGRRAAVRTEETNMGNLTARANLFVAQKYDRTTCVSLKNGGGIRAEIGAIDGITGELLPPQANPESGKGEGQISQLDIENTLRFNNGLTLITLTPAQLVQVLEHAVSESGGGNTPGRFAQVAGLTFSFDPRDEAGKRVKMVRLTGECRQPLVYRKGRILGKKDRKIRIVTLNFLANGGDSYPYPDFVEADPDFANRVDLVDENAPRTGAAVFAPDGSEQDALAEYLDERYSGKRAFDEAETPVEQDRIIRNLEANESSKKKFGKRLIKIIRCLAGKD